MINVDVLFEDSNWSKKIKKKDNFFHSICKAFPKKYQFINKKVFLTLLLSNNKSIKKLNKQFRNKDQSTDVLSFPFYEKDILNKKITNNKEIYLGDIIVNLNKIKNKNDKNKFKDQFNKLWIHGLVHLFGHNHKKDKDFYIMEKLEKKYLKYIN